MTRCLKHLFSIPALFKDFRSHNQAPLYIKTFDGSDSPFHPTVLYFPTGWNGHCYWMSESPYPPKALPYRDRWECPCIHVSDDGIHWYEPDGLVNPIDDVNEEQISRLGYLSDPHIFLRDNVVECWYRITDRQGNDSYGSDDSMHQLLRRTSIDGIHWGNRELLLDISAEFGRELVSQAVLNQDNKYKMWIVDLDKTKINHYPVIYMESVDAIHWSPMQQCVFCGERISPWHIDVQFFDGQYWLTCYERIAAQREGNYFISGEKVSLWKSTDGINYQYEKTLLKTPHIIGSFYSRGFYRSCLCKVSDSDYRLYFSAVDRDRTYVGLMQGNSPTTMEIISADGGKHHNWIQFLSILYHETLERISARLK